MGLEITKEDIVIDCELKRKVDVICSFCRVKPIYKNGSIRKINKTNIIYIEPHKIIINDITLLTFNEHDFIYIGNLKNKMPFSKLKEFLKTMPANGNSNL